MSGTLSYYWRIGVTGTCFAVFGIGGMLFSALLFPLMRLLPGGKDVRQARARKVVSVCFRMLIRTLLAFNVMTLEINGLERLVVARGALILANHPSYIDVVILLALLPEAHCVVKGGLWRNLFYAGVVRATGYISNAEPGRFIIDAVQSMRNQAPLLMFPEGTRTEPGKPLRFQRGASYIALASNCDIVPVILECDPPTLTKNQRWYEVPSKPFHFRLDVKAPFKASDLVDTNELATIAARRLTEALETYFTRELAHGRTTSGD